MTPNKPARIPAQLIASRTNGAKSKGPITPAGKSRISSNRMTHGFRSNSITLANEDHQAYDRHLDAYLLRYTPIDKPEEDLVGLLASNMWQIMRNNSIEVALFELEISGVVTDIEGEFETMDQYGLLALAFKKSAGDNALEVLRRYKSTAERAYHRAFQALEQIQKDRKPNQPTPTREPEEIPTTVQTQAVPKNDDEPSTSIPETEQNPTSTANNPLRYPPMPGKSQAKLVPIRPSHAQGTKCDPEF